jgi:hypothetical protein
MDNLFADSLNKTSQGIQEEIDKLEEQKKKMWYSREATINLTNTEKEYAKQLEIVNGNYKQLYDQGKLTYEQKGEYSESLKREIELTRDLGYDVSGLEAQYEKLNGKTYTATLELDTGDFERKVRILSEKDLVKLASITPTQRFASGGIVTQPTRALIGEAGYPEAVVPMTDSYLSTLAQLIGQYGGGSGNGVTNVYLDGRLIQRQMSNRENEVRFATNK